MEQAPEHISKLASLMDMGWPWILIVPVLLSLVFVIVPIGVWLSVIKRNKILQGQVEALQYQTEILKWVGNVIKEGANGGR